jgi:hypothetical protein
LRYSPLRELAAPGENKLGPLLAPLWDKSHADTKRAYAEFVRSEGEHELTVHLPPCDYSTDSTPVSLDYREGAVATLSVRIGCDLKPSCYEDVFAALEASFGKPTTSEVAGLDVHVYRSTAPQIAAWSREGFVTLEVARDKTSMLR